MDITDEPTALSSEPSHNSANDLTEGQAFESVNYGSVTGPLKIRHESTSHVGPWTTTWTTLYVDPSTTEHTGTTILTSPTTTTTTLTPVPTTDDILDSSSKLF